jgi:hypothetical protein
MSTRERWIVYPLLFLALGAAIKPKLEALEPGSAGSGRSSLTVDRIRCRELYVVDEDNRTRILIAPETQSGDGEIRITNGRGQALVRLKADAASRAGLVETLDDDGKAQAALMSGETGGQVLAYDSAQANAVLLGHQGGEPGVFKSDLRTGKAEALPAR